MRQDNQIAFLASLVLALFVAEPAHADIVNDGLAGGNLITTNSPMGQTFVAVDSSIHSIGIGILVMNPPESGEFNDVNLILRLGSSISGPIIAHSGALPHPQLFEDWTDFFFDPPLSVDIGRTYTLQIVDTSFQWGVWLDDHLSDSYPDGYVWLDGAHSSTEKQDMRFRVLAAERPGVCCWMNQCLQDVNETDCRDIWNGVHQGTGSYCPNVDCVRAACCDGVWGSCDMLQERSCNLKYRDSRTTFQRGTQCGPESCNLDGDCCFADTCLDSQERHSCEQEGGLWLGRDTCGYNRCPFCQDGDLDRDADFDLADFWVMQNCHALGPVLNCACADLDGNLDIGLSDVARMIPLLTGPSQ